MHGFLQFSSQNLSGADKLQTKYGKETEIEKCFVKEILDLPNISGSDCPVRIEEFCEKLTHQGNVSMTLDKLSGIRGDLVRSDPEWETWDFVQLHGRSLKSVGKKKLCYECPKGTGGFKA